jgi:hypothetical protein
VASAAAATAGLSGCSANLFSGSNPLELGDAVTKSGTTVAVDSVDIYDSYLVVSQAGYVYPRNDWGVKHALAFVTVSGDDPPRPSDLTLVTDDGTTIARGRHSSGNVGPESSLYGFSPRYRPERGVLSGPVLFDFPFDELSSLPSGAKPDELYIEWNGTRWRLTSDHRAEATEGKPWFEFVNFDPPETHPSDEPLRIEIQVENTDDVDGIFRGALHLLSPRPSFVSEAESAIPIKESVDAGERGTWSVEFDPDFLADVSRLRFDLRTLAGHGDTLHSDRQFTVELVD